MGGYTLTVDARHTGAAAADPPDATGLLAFDIINPFAGVTLSTPSVPDPHVNGTAITFTAGDTGSTGYQYRFNLDGAMVQDCSTTNTFTLSLLTPAGNHTITADVRTRTIFAAPDASASSGAYTVLEDAISAQLGTANPTSSGGTSRQGRSACGL